MKAWATTLEEDHQEPRVFGYARWREDLMKVSSELARDRRAWSASVRDVVNSIGDAGLTHHKYK